MNVALFTFVDLYAKGLDTLAGILAKAAAHAHAIGESEAQMLDWRLADDMFPLRRQAQIVCDFARQWPARAAGLEVPASIAGEPDLAQLQAAIAEAKAWLRGLDAADFEGRDDVAFTLDLGLMKPTLPMGQWISGFATTNFYFHLSMAYAIARSKGAPLGKADMFGGGL